MRNTGNTSVLVESNRSLEYCRGIVLPKLNQAAFHCESLNNEVTRLLIARSYSQPAVYSKTALQTHRYRELVSPYPRHPLSKASSPSCSNSSD